MHYSIENAKLRKRGGLNNIIDDKKYREGHKNKIYVNVYSVVKEN